MHMPGNHLTTVVITGEGKENARGADRGMVVNYSSGPGSATSPGESDGPTRSLIYQAPELMCV